MRAQGETDAKIKNGKIVKEHGKPSGYYSVPTNGNKLVKSPYSLRLLLINARSIIKGEKRLALEAFQDKIV